MDHQPDQVEATLQFQLSLLNLFAANGGPDQAPKKEATRLEEILARRYEQP